MSFESRIEDLLDQWEIASDPRPTIEELCRDCPEFIPELRRRIEEIIKANRVVGDISSRDIDTSLDMADLVPGFQIIEAVGSGGMGIVYRARQLEHLNRIVAIKVIKMGMDTRRFLMRFRAEREVMSQLSHPGITAIIDAGNTKKGRPYYIMEYVPGSPVTQFADTEKLNIHERLELFIEICNAVGYAHTKAIIHRDLKPSNILAFNNPEGKRVVKIIDFGVAKALQENSINTESPLTETGTAIGTFHYMSPEQAEGSRDVDIRSDIYSLGVILYELLTGVRPFEAVNRYPSTNEHIRRLVMGGDPVRPSTRMGGLGDLGPKVADNRNASIDDLARKLRDELEWIPLKAMKKNREGRYQNAEQFAEDIRNYLEGRALLAGMERRGYATKKWIYRHRTGVLTFGISIMCLVLATTISTYFLVESNRLRVIAEEASKNAIQSNANADRVQKELVVKNSELEKQTEEAIKAKNQLVNTLDQAEKSKLELEQTNRRLLDFQSKLADARKGGTETESRLDKLTILNLSIETQLAKQKSDYDVLALALKGVQSELASKIIELESSNRQLVEVREQLQEVIATTQSSQKVSPTSQPITFTDMNLLVNWCIESAEGGFKNITTVNAFPKSSVDQRLSSVASIEWRGDDTVAPWARFREINGTIRLAEVYIALRDKSIEEFHVLDSELERALLNKGYLKEKSNITKSTSFYFNSQLHVQVKTSFDSREGPDNDFIYIRISIRDTN